MDPWIRGCHYDHFCNKKTPGSYGILVPHDHEGSPSIFWGWQKNCWELDIWPHLMWSYCKTKSKCWKTCKISCFLIFFNIGNSSQFLELFSKFCLGRTLNEVHIFNVHVKTQLLRYHMGGFWNFFFYPRRWMENIQ